MEQRRIAMIGAGALGALYGSHFMDAGFDLTYISAPERADRLSAGGLVVNGTAYSVSVATPAGEPEPADIVMIAVKYHGLPDAVREIRRFVGPDTVIMSVMNGIDSEDMLASAYGREHVLYTVALGMDAVRDGNNVHFTTAGKLLIGTVKDWPNQELFDGVTSVLTQAGLAFEERSDMLHALWWKYMINVGMNQVSAVLRLPYGAFHSSKRVQELMRDAMRECIAVAQAEDVSLSEKDLENWYPVLHTLSAAGKTSMLQDVEAGRKTEVEMFAGKLLELAERHGLSLPVNEMLYRLITAIEEFTGS